MAAVHVKSCIGGRCRSIGLHVHMSFLHHEGNVKVHSCFEVLRVVLCKVTGSH